ncbi:MAG: hypothetical protein Q8L55_06085 [Phycisphaerales bacterium]|nr:hypothetical protein [Phycisphaerales bacterium]
MRGQNLKCIASVGAIALVSLAGTASADVILPLGMGWEAVITGSNVTLTVVPSTDGVLHLTKDAVFTEIDPFTGAPMPITIMFRQVLPDNQTASQIIIDSEMIMNLTGLNWDGFRQILGLSNNVSFDPSSTGMSVGPEFTTNTLLNGNREMLSNGGPGVANGAMWMPGATGALVININLAGQDSPVIFTLKELPTVPTPGAVALGAIGLAAMGRRRR